MRDTILDQIQLRSALAPDLLRVRELRASEALSELFAIELDLEADLEAKIPFDQLLAKPVSISLESDVSQGAASKPPRHFHGIVSRFTQLNSDSRWSHYRMRVSPSLWFLTKRTNCRVFQQKSVVEILQEFLDDIPTRFDLQRNYHQHNYCVQYGETDFAFISRLMEEEGIFYYFTHEADRHLLHIADSSPTNPSVPFDKRVRFDANRGGVREDEPIFSWQVTQEVASSQYEVWDHNFELPSHHLEANATPPASVLAGKTPHPLQMGSQHHLSVFDFPGAFGHRFDGIGPEGSAQWDDLQKVFQQNQQTAQIRMEEQVASSLLIEGASVCRRLNPGLQFELTHHQRGNGTYLVKRVLHRMRVPDFASGDDSSIAYENTFECLPHNLPFRAPRQTPRPRISGTQSATVVGPKGEEIFTDRYGRIKVQFRWDRYGQSDERSSCWVRVGYNWAGGRFGQVHIPRIGQEVLIAFLEGDPDAPIVVGNVYNADQMPPFDLPEDKNVSGIKTRSRSGSQNDFHGLAFDDTQGHELIQFRSQRDMITEVRHNHSLTVPNQQITRLGGYSKHIVGGGGLSSPPSSSDSSDGSGDGSGVVSDWPRLRDQSVAAVLLQNVIGGLYDGIIGIHEEGVTGRHNEIWLDPVQLMLSCSPSANPLKLSIGGLLGHSEWNMGGECNITYGTKVEIHRGPLFEFHPDNKFGMSSDWKVILIAMSSLVAAGSMLALSILPTIDQHDLPWSSEDEKTICYALWLAKILGQWLTTLVEATFCELNNDFEILEGIERRLDGLGDVINYCASHIQVAAAVTAATGPISSTLNTIESDVRQLDIIQGACVNGLARLADIATHGQRIEEGNYSMSTSNGNIYLSASNSAWPQLPMMPIFVLGDEPEIPVIDEVPEVDVDADLTGTGNIELEAGSNSANGTISLTAGASLNFRTSMANMYLGASVPLVLDDVVDEDPSPIGAFTVQVDSADGSVTFGAGEGASMSLDSSPAGGAFSLTTASILDDEVGVITISPLSYKCQVGSFPCSVMTMNPLATSLGFAADGLTPPISGITISEPTVLLRAGENTIAITEAGIVLTVGGTAVTLSAASLTNLSPLINGLE
ncbi:Phage-related baseplate assembly protein [Planctomycetes bacterium Pan216]|uniref:Phage-related baseplate assembly protein n=1 Tax=Kolteria novifilia TaxID=2527975 RepID=A0A518B7R5_9BACT|nr:Phage-related baseplate assembly protein [Planctomycetes bacterium Pan216]